jgi:hypothetical protein
MHGMEHIKKLTALSNAYITTPEVQHHSVTSLRIVFFIKTPTSECMWVTDDSQ